MWWVRNKVSKVSSKTPKVLTKFYNKNYLDLVIEKCINFKIKKLILATGHLHEEIEKYLRNKLFELNNTQQRKRTFRNLGCNFKCKTIY